MPEPELPPAPGSTLTVALEVELERVRQAIDAALPRAERQDWTLVTREGASPRIELRYVVERDDVVVKFSKGALRTVVPLRYWADVRGAVESPLPWHRDRWFALDRDQTWGTRAQPQRASLVVLARARLDEHGALRVESRIEQLDPGPPPAGSICVKAGIRFCVGKQSLAGEVDKAFERRVAPLLRDALAKLDRGLERAADTRARLSRAWRALHCAWPLHRPGGLVCATDAAEQGTWLQLVPRAIAASELGRSGKRLRVLVALEGRMQVTRGAPVRASGSGELPAVATRKLGKGSALHVPVAIPYDLLSSQLGAGLPSAPLSLGRAGTARLVGARVLGARADQAGVRCVVELKLSGDADGVFYAYARPRAAAGALELGELEYSAETQRELAAALPDVDHAQLRRALAGALRIALEPAAAGLLQALSAAVAQAEPALQPAITVSRLALAELRPGPRSLVALLTIEGRVRVALDPARALPAR